MSFIKLKYFFRYSIAILIGCCSSNVIKAQQNKLATFLFDFQTSVGSLFKHTQHFTGPIPPISSSTQMNFLWKTNGQKEWQTRRHNPTVGFTVAYNFYDTYWYGQSIGICPSIELPILKYNNFEWSLRFGTGLGYISKHYKPYAPNLDTLNNAMGAHINNYGFLSSDLRYSISQHSKLFAGVTFNHMSSAKFRLPNLGLNYIGGHIGIRYYPNKIQNDIALKKPLNSLPNRYLISIKQGVGMTTGESIGSAATPVYIRTLAINKRYWSHNKVWAGIDYSYFQSVYNFSRLQALGIGNEKNNAWNLGVFVAHEFMYGRAGIYFQIGTYLKQTILPKAPIYQRLGINWYIHQKETGLVKDIYIGTLLKTHYATAEHAELALGISF